ncbi:MAG: DUF4038 domain-containing protein, partial [Candidatus Hydrogenedentes bacterium]|nr:DUF4038 domain-containing protein [Candidatus Hydrogenedentota bacterium]
WLGDTWWMGLSTRLDWPDGFQWLAQDRIQKGFNVIQIIAGPYPDMDVWDPRGQSEAGFPFTENFASINPEHYNLADQKFAYLVESGLTPCIVGMWGYYLPQLGVDKIKRYWRYLIARYGAYPVVWCIAGEATMPYYLSENKDAEGAQQREGWTEVMRYVRDTDPFHNIITIHPTQFGRDQVSEPELLSFDMLQTGHSDLETVPNVITTVRRSLEREPPMPVVNGEVNYEGILGRAWQNIQRLCFYHTVMNGAAGHTYGANGIWQFNGDDKPYGPSPHGRAWGNTPWREAAALPGSAQLGRGAALWRTLPWWEMRPHPEWVKTSKEPDDPYGTVCAGIPERLRVIYSPMAWDAPTVLGVESSVRYTAMYFDPVKGEKIDLGEVKPDANGSWTPPLPPEVHDWLLILNAES